MKRRCYKQNDSIILYIIKSKMNLFNNLNFKLNLKELDGYLLKVLIKLGLVLNILIE